MLINKAILFSLILTSILCNTSSRDCSQQDITGKKQKESIEEKIYYHEQKLEHYKKLQKQKTHNDKDLWQQVVNTCLLAEKAVHDNCLEPLCVHCCLPCFEVFINWYSSNPKHTS